MAWCWRNVHNETHVHEATEDDFGITQDHYHVASRNLALGRVSPQISLQACFDIGPFIFSQPFRLFRAVIFGSDQMYVSKRSHDRANKREGPSRVPMDLQSGEKKEKHDTNKDGNATLDDEDPTPSVVSSETIHYSSL